LVPSLDGGDDFVRVGRPGEWLRVGVGFSDESVDGRLEIDDGAEDTTFQSTSAELGEKSLDPGGRDEAGKLIPIDLKVGDRVLFGKWSGTEVKENANQ
jgi:chaperonin GroES